jgi:hypothetical protein
MHDNGASRAVSIAQSGTTSAAFRTGPYRNAFGIQFPSQMTGATVSFVGSTSEDGTYSAVHDSSGAISLAATASTAVFLDENEAKAVLAFPYIKVVSADAEAAARALIVLMT